MSVCCHPQCPHITRCRAMRKRLERFQGLLPDSQGHDPALTVLYVSYSLVLKAARKASLVIKGDQVLPARVARPVSSYRPHCRVRPFHQKSTCLTLLNLGPYVVQIWSRDPNFKVTKTSNSTKRFDAPGTTLASALTDANCNPGMSFWE